MDGINDAVQGQAAKQLDTIGSLLTAEFYTVLGLLIVGMLIGMAMTGLAKTWLKEARTEVAQAKRFDFLKRFGQIASGSWVLLLELRYLAVGARSDWFLALQVAAGAGILAAYANHYAYKPVALCYDGGLAWLKTKFKFGE